MFFDYANSSFSERAGGQISNSLGLDGVSYSAPSVSGSFAERFGQNIENSAKRNVAAGQARMNDSAGYKPSDGSLNPEVNDELSSEEDNTVPPNSGYGGYAPSSAPQTLQYIDAPMAEAYGMDASTAYNEALSNTAYQRKVKDLQAAGLNPVLGISGAGADNFYGTPIAQGGVGGSGSGSASSISDQATKLGYWLPVLMNGVVNGLAWAVTKNSMSGFSAGMVAQNITSGVLSSIRNSDN